MSGQKIVNIPGIGVASFPDSMADSEIVAAIQQQQRLAVAKPGPYSTKLSPSSEANFQSWIRQVNPGGWQDSPTADYDMRGYWQAMQAGDPNAKQAANQHFPDTYKTPYHQTFSAESMYATPDAPRWQGDDAAGWRLIDKAGKVLVTEGQPSVPAMPVPYGLQ